MKVLALDIGMRRTGVAFADEADGIVLALHTLEHASKRELAAAVRLLCTQRGIGMIVIGLPLLPSGKEGAQAGMVRDMGTRLAALGLPLLYLDERYTTQDNPDYDGDAAAAVELLRMALSRRQRTP